MMRNSLAAAVLLSFIAAGAAQAAHVQYTFATAHGPTGAVNADDIVALLGTNASVAGSFTYDNAASFYGNSGALGADPGYAIYIGATPATTSFANLVGTVAGFGFSDTVGGTAVGNNLVSPSIPFPFDVLSLLADPSVPSGSVAIPDRPRQISGFTIGDYTLHNVRMYWSASAAYLPGDALPAQLPVFNGTLALDFVRTDDPANTASGVPYHNRTVLFQGLSVQVAPVPEPGAAFLALTGLAMVGGVALARRRSAR